MKHLYCPEGGMSVIEVQTETPFIWANGHVECTFISLLEINPASMKMYIILK